MVAFAYLARDRVFARLEGDASPREIESPYGQSVRARAAKIARRNAWKSQGRGARFMMGFGGAPEDALDREGPPVPITYAGLSRGGNASEIVYALTSGVVSGLFAYDVEKGEERRLFHGADAHVADPAYHDDEHVFVCTLRGKGGMAHIAVMRGEGSDLIELTEGDAVDGAPSWIPGERAIVFQTSGIGRDRAGNIAGFAPAAVHRLDVEKGSIEPVLEDERFDYTSPRVSKDGVLHALRKPRITTRAPINPFRVLLQAVLFPFRLLWAFIQFLNFFGARYTGKPLITSGDAKTRRADARQMMIAGNLIDAAREGDEEDEPKIDPRWELVRKRGEEIEVVARGVLCFDLCDDGGVIWSDGSSVRHQSHKGATETLAKDRGIHEILALRSTHATA
jgi:hypothetical protein